MHTTTFLTEHILENYIKTVFHQLNVMMISSHIFLSINTQFNCNSVKKICGKTNSNKSGANA